MTNKPLSGGLGLLWLFVAFTVQAQKLPARKEILAKMTLANAYFMATWPDPVRKS